MKLSRVYSWVVRLLLWLLLTVGALLVLAFILINLKPVTDYFCRRIEAAVPNLHIGSLTYYPFHTLELQNVSYADSVVDFRMQRALVKANSDLLLHRRLSFNEVYADSLSVVVLQSVPDDTVQQPLHLPKVWIDGLNVQNASVRYGNHRVAGLILKCSDIFVSDSLKHVAIERCTALYNDSSVAVSGSVSLVADTLNLHSLTAQYGQSSAKIASATAVFQPCEFNGIELPFNNLKVAVQDLKHQDIIRAAGEVSFLHDAVTFNSFGVELTEKQFVNVDGKVCGIDNPLSIKANAKVDGAVLVPEIGLTHLSLKAKVLDKEQDKQMVILSAESDKLSVAGTVFFTDSLQSIRNVNGTLTAGVTEWGVQQAKTQLSLKGRVSPNANQCFAQMEGFVNQLVYNKYAYSPVETKLMLTNTEANALFSLTDNNGSCVAVVHAEQPADGNVMGSVTLKADSVRLCALGFTPQTPNAELSSAMRLTMQAPSFGNLSAFNATLHVSDLHYKGLPAPLEINDMVATVENGSADGLQIALSSNLLNGNAMFKVRDWYKFRANDKMNVNLSFSDITPLLQLVDTLLVMDGSGFVQMNKNQGERAVSADIRLPKSSYGSWNVGDLTFNVGGTIDTVNIRMSTPGLQNAVVGDLGKVEALANLTTNGTYDLSLATSSGNLRAWAWPGADGTECYKLDSTTFMLAGRAWHIDSVEFLRSKDRMSVDHFCMQTFGEPRRRAIEINGTASANVYDTLSVNVERLHIEDYLHHHPDDKYSLAGDVNADLKLSNVLGDIHLNCDVLIDSLIALGDDLGIMKLNSRWQAQENNVAINGDIITNGRSCTRIAGYVDLAKEYMNIDFDIDSLSVGFLNYFLYEAIDNMRGTTSGWLTLGGPLDNLKLYSRLGIHQIKCSIKQTNVDYEFLGNDTIALYPDKLVAENLRFKDRYGKQGVFHGYVDYDMFSNLFTHLDFDVHGMEVLNTTPVQNPIFYGQVFGEGRLHVSGPTVNIRLDVNATPVGDSELTVQLSEKSELSSQNGWLAFNSTQKNDSSALDAEVPLEGLEAYINVDIKPNAKILAIIDPQTRNELWARGSGPIAVNVLRNGDITMQGTYKVSEGNYTFSFKDIASRNFVISEGSTVTWAADPVRPTLNLKAQYNTSASLQDLIGSKDELGGMGDLKRKVPVNVDMHITEQIINPNINFNIEIPSTQNFSQSLFNQYVNTEEEMQRQVFSLLIRNRFARSEQSSALEENSTNVLATTLSDFVTNKFSDWVSQNDRNISVGVTYNPGDVNMNEEYAVGMQTDVLGGKVLLKGNIGYSNDVNERNSQQDMNNFIGDFDVEVKLNQSGTVRAKAYTHSNNDVIYQTSPTTQGIGISFRNEFYNFGNMWRSWMQRIFRRRPSEETAEESDGDEVGKDAR